MKRATLTFSGDIMCCQPQLEACRTDNGFDFSNIFAKVRPLLTKDDFCIGNLETPFAGEKASYTNEPYRFNTPDSFAVAVKDAGFDLVSTANNHCLDRGLDGLFATLDTLESIGLDATGTARSPEEQRKIRVYCINGIRIAFLAYTYGTNAFANSEFLLPRDGYAVNLFQPQETLPGAIHLLKTAEQIQQDMQAQATETTYSPFLEQAKADIENARKAADYVIFLMHCGGQYNPVPEAYTEFIVRRLREFGADLIIGNHAHVPQKFNLAPPCPIFYCLGNFATSPNETGTSASLHPESNLSILLHVTIVQDNNGTRLEDATWDYIKCMADKSGKAIPCPVSQNDLTQREKEFLHCWLALDH